MFERPLSGEMFQNLEGLPKLFIFLSQASSCYHDQNSRFLFTQVPKPRLTFLIKYQTYYGLRLLYRYSKLPSETGTPCRPNCLPVDLVVNLVTILGLNFEF